MSQYYEIALECGSDEAAADQCQAYLSTLAATIPKAFVSRRRYPEGDIWVNLAIPWNVLDEAGWAALLMTLWRIPLFDLQFRFALAGLDVDIARTYEEMLEETDWDIFTHYALSDPLWQAVGRPPGFVPVGRHHARGWDIAQQNAPI